MSLQPVYDPETEGYVYHVVPTYQTESISDFTSESESAMSGMTIQSDEVSGYFITHHGRQQPASESALRWMPSDNTRRDILRHVVEKYMFGNNYLGPVREMLNSEAGGEYHVLEIGTRSGTWVQEMALEFPHVQFRSVDVAPLVLHAPRSNIVFEVYDLSEGIPAEDNSQDIVFINSGVELAKNYRALLLEAHRVLRPGGLIHIREFVLGLWDREDYSKPAVETNPAGCRVFELMGESLTRYGAQVDVCDKLHQLLSPGSELWRDAGKPGGFERIFPTVKMIPLRPHPGHPCAARIDPQMIWLIAHFHGVCARDSVSLLCDAGLGDEEANALVEEMLEESKDPEKCSFIRWNAVHATKMFTTYCD